MLITLLLSMFWAAPVHAMDSDHWYLSGSYYTQNSLNKTTKSASGAPSTLGQVYYPIGLAYAFTAGPQSSFAPSLEYTLLPRTSSDGGMKASLLILTLPYTQRFFQSWDWSLGLTAIQYTLKGKGGTKQMNNGTGTATFALPGRTVSTLNFATLFALGYNFQSMRLQLGANVEAMLSNERRSFDLFFMLQYEFGGGGYR